MEVVSEMLELCIDNCSLQPLKKLLNCVVTNVLKHYMLIVNLNKKITVCYHKPTIGNESLHESSNDNGVRVANFATSKHLVVKSTMFFHRKIH
jgi:hypothetical protein